MSDAAGKGVIFDLDGTLVDSAPDLHWALNHVLAEEGLPTLPLETVKSLIGHGLARLVEGGFAAVGAPRSRAALAARLGRFTAIYAANLARLTRPFPGVPEVLMRLTEAGWRLGVCSNKSTALARSLLTALGLERAFAAVVGGDATPYRKPHPAPLRLALRQLGVHDAVYVGDSAIDIATARTVGVPVLLVSHGYAEDRIGALAPDLVLDDIRSLPEVLQTSAPAGVATG